MDLFTLVAKLTMDSSEYVSGLTDAGKKAKDFEKDNGSLSSSLQKTGQSLTSAGKSITGVGKTLAPVSLAVAGLGGAAIKTAADFDTSMSNVAAISGATGKDFDSLRDKAREMGAKTKFSASEAADAMSYMAMAGWKTGDMLDGVEGIMNLAAASGENLASTSDIVTDALTGFGLSASDSGHFADVLAAASNNANTNVSLLGESFKYVAPVAGSFGFSVEDVSAALGLMANAGIKGSQAGTALRTMLTNMAKPTDKMSDAMNALGVSLSTDSGEMKSLREIMDDLRSGFGKLKIPADELESEMAKLDEEYQSGNMSLGAYNKGIDELITRAYGAEGAEKAKYAAMLAGKEGMSGLLAIVNATDEDYKKLTESLDSASQTFVKTTDGAIIPMSEALAKGLEWTEEYNGEAEKMAAIMQDNLNGQLTILKSQLEELAISFGDIMMPLIRDAVTFVQNLVDKLNSMDDSQRKVIITIGAVVAAAAPVLMVIGAVISSLGTVAGAIGTVIGVMSGPLILAIGAVIAAVALVVNHWDEIVSYAQTTLLPVLQGVWEGIKEAIGTAFEGIKGFWESVLLPAFEAIIGYVENTIVPAMQNAWENIILPLISLVFENIKNAWEMVLKPAFEAIGNFLTGTLLPAFQTVWEGTILPLIESVFGAISAFWTGTLLPTFTAISDFLWGTVLPTFQKVWKTTIQPLVEKVFSKISEFWNKTLKPAFDAITKFISNTLTPAFKKGFEGYIRPAVEKVFSAIKAAWEKVLKPAFEAVQKFVTDTLLPAFQKAFGIIQPLVEKVFTAISNVWNNVLKPAFEAIKRIVGELQTKFETSFGAASKTVETVFKAIKGFWEGTLKPAFDKIKTVLGEIQTKFKDVWDGASKKVDTVFKAIKGFWEGTLKPVFDKIKTILGDIQTKFKDVWDAASKKVGEVFKAIKGFWEGTLKPPFDKIKTTLGDIQTKFKDVWDAAAKKVSDKFGAIKKSWTDTLSPAFTNLQTTLGNIQTKANTVFGAVATKVSDVFTGRWGIASKITDAMTSIGNAFRNANFSFPHVKLPYFSVSWNTFGPVQLPSVSVSWYKKAYDNPFLFSSPTIMATGSGFKGFGDGNGGEIVYGRNNLLNDIREATSGNGGTNNFTFNIYTQPGQNTEEIAKAVQREFVRWDNQRRAAYV